MTIFKLRTRDPALHPQLTDLIVRADGLKIEAHRFGAVVQRPEIYPVVIPWQNVAEVEVDDAEGFLEEVGEPMRYTGIPISDAEALHPLPLQRQKVDATWRAVKDPASPAKKRK